MASFAIFLKSAQENAKGGLTCGMQTDAVARFATVFAFFAS
jgi:hypothetical protein